MMTIPKDKIIETKTVITEGMDCLTQVVSLTQSNFGFQRLVIRPNKSIKTVKMIGMMNKASSSKGLRAKIRPKAKERMMPKGTHKRK